MSSSFRSILQQVTQEKLEELKLQKNLMTSHFSPVLSQVGEGQLPLRDALSLLYTAVKSSPVKETVLDAVLIDNLKSLLEHSAQDPSISDQLVGAWVTRVKAEVEFALRKCEYSYLYGSLLSEWLEVEEKRRRRGQTQEPQEPQEPKEPTAVPQDKGLEALKALLFSAPTKEEFDAEIFRNFLSSELFSFGDNVEGEKVFLAVVKETKNFFKPEDYYISTHDVICCIRGLCSEELLSQEKKNALQELSQNSEALEEVASLLTSRLKHLDRWEWPAQIGEEITELRRGLSGVQKAYLNEDIITALFLQYVGVEWGSYFKRQFFNLYDSKAWVKKDCNFGQSIEGKRLEFHRSTFLQALPDSISAQESRNKEEYAKIEAEEVVERAVCFAAGAPQRNQLFSAMEASDDMGGGSNFSFGSPQAAPAPKMMMKRMATRQHPPRPPKGPKSELDFKQQFLHVLTTEIKLNATLRPDKALQVVQADLDSFGPSLVQEAGLIALEFLGVESRWLGFFRKFLTPKLRFVEGEESQRVQRGIHNSHAISNLFGETLMFLLEFLVNRKCDGMRIYRIYDELWFWSHDSEHVVKAWDTLQTYGKMVGLKVNENRSGSVAVLSPEEFAKRATNLPPTISGPSPLPRRNIHWGYLELWSNGVFHIDQKAVKKFLDEMKALLDKSECVLEWINIFNKYFSFFVRNFGKSAVASGTQHLDQILTALNTIYSGLLIAGAKDPVTSLKAKFTILSAADVVDAWVYWPLERGGLGLVNPFISIMALKGTFVEMEKNTTEMNFARLPDEDKALYEELKKEHERIYGPQTKVAAPMNFGPGPVPPTRPKLKTWEEYVASRETELVHWYWRYVHLLERPGPLSPALSAAFGELDLKGEEAERNYFQWLFSYYETQLKGHFGGVTFINAKLLPMSMIANIQKAKVQH